MDPYEAWAAKARERGDKQRAGEGLFTLAMSNDNLVRFVQGALRSQPAPEPEPKQSIAPPPEDPECPWLKMVEPCKGSVSEFAYERKNLGRKCAGDYATDREAWDAFVGCMANRESLKEAQEWFYARACVRTQRQRGSDLNYWRWPSVAKEVRWEIGKRRLADYSLPAVAYTIRYRNSSAWDRATSRVKDVWQSVVDRLRACERLKCGKPPRCAHRAISRTFYAGDWTDTEVVKNWSMIAAYVIREIRVGRV